MNADLDAPSAADHHGDRAAPATDADDRPTAGLVPSPAEVVEAQIEPLLHDLPTPKREEILHKVGESLTAFVATSFQGGGPKLDAESVRLIAAAVEKDNDNKFKYLIQKEQHESEHKNGELAFRRERHHDHVTLLKPILSTAIVVLVLSITAGIWLIWRGQEAIGIGILVSMATSVFGFLGGLGVSNFFKNR